MNLTPLVESTNTLRTIRVSQGLFVLRYVSSKAGLNAPSVSVATREGSGVDVISPGEGDARLISPGDGLVIRATRDSLINVSVTPSHKNGSLDAELVLERVSTTIRQAVPLSVPEDFSRQGATPAVGDIEILGHVARRGDVLVRPGQWICGPSLPMAIEGLEIRWNGRPPGVEIFTRATIKAKGLQSLGEQPIGSFQGTRGRAAPITALTLSIVGPGSDDFSLACDALFLGLAVKSVAGKTCVLSGATGHEPLVGLRLSVVSAVEKAARQSVDFLRTTPREEARASLPKSLPLERPGRVRIFRTPRGRPASAALLTK